MTPMKSSMYISSNFINFVGQFWYVFGRKSKFASPSMILFRGCGSNVALFCMFFIATSLAVSVAAQKNGGIHSIPFGVHPELLTD